MIKIGVCKNISFIDGIFDFEINFDSKEEA